MKKLQNFYFEPQNMTKRSPCYVDCTKIKFFLRTVPIFIYQNQAIRSRLFKYFWVVFFYRIYLSNQPKTECNIKSNAKWSKAGLNSEFSFF